MIARDVHRWDRVRVLLARSKHTLRVEELHLPEVQEKIRRSVHRIVDSMSGAVVSINGRDDLVIDFPGGIDDPRQVSVVEVLRMAIPDDTGCYWEGTKTRIVIEPSQIYVSFVPEGEDL